jgi:hypothetical protein
MPIDDDDLEQSRAITLPIFHHENDRFEVYRVPRTIKKLSAIRELYSVKLIDEPTPGASFTIRLAGPEMPATKPSLPAAYAEFNDYKVFIRDTSQVGGFVTRFKGFLDIMETSARLRVWSKAEGVVDKLVAAIQEEEGKKRR